MMAPESSLPFEPPPESDLATLRKEIRRAGAATRVVRWGCWLPAAAILGLNALITVGVCDFYFPGRVGWALRLEPVGWVVVTGGIAWALASGVRAMRRAELRRSLTKLPPAT